MMDPVRELKTRAEILHARITTGDAASLERLRALPELRRADAGALAAMAQGAQRKHCLAVVAREHGFSSWEHARRVLGGEPGESDFGTLLYGLGVGGILNDWFADYDEARAFLDDARRRDLRRYLLAYERHFVVVERTYVEALGLDPDDPDWQAIDFDWARPRDPEARRRLYARRLAALRGSP
jgi:hypothetical protein